MVAAGSAVRTVLKTQLEAMRAHEAGVIADRDPEDLHRYRVALRRTRSCLGQMKGALPRKRMAKFKPEFAWLGEVTGPTRDLDVFLDDMKRYRKTLDGASLRDLESLIELIEHDKVSEHARLTAQLDTDRYRSLISGWSGFLNAPFDVAEAPHAGRPIAEVAAERIHSRYERMIRRGRRLDAMTETDRLHRLRIDGKKLRYLLEFFRDEFPTETITPLIATLKRLQDHLGRFNDFQVQRDSVSSMAGRLKSAGSTSTVEHLLEQLTRKERRVRRRFADEFERFDNEETARRIPALGISR